MRCFFDTSALLKRYLADVSSPQVEKILGKATAVIVSSITRAEFYSALGSNLKTGKLTTAEHADRIAEGEADFGDFEVIMYTVGIESLVKRLSARYGHRTLDNIQLASAIVAKPRYFITADKKLAKLASAEKLHVKLV